MHPIAKVAKYSIVVKDVVTGVDKEFTKETYARLSLRNFSLM
jgi:hypothetical protein